MGIIFLLEFLRRNIPRDVSSQNMNVQKIVINIYSFDVYTMRIDKIKARKPGCKLKQPGFLYFLLRLRVGTVPSYDIINGNRN